MTKKQAIQTLLESAKRDIQGSGMGYRSTSDEWRKKVIEAMKIVHPTLYNFPFADVY